MESVHFFEDIYFYFRCLVNFILKLESNSPGERLWFFYFLFLFEITVSLLTFKRFILTQVLFVIKWTENIRTGLLPEKFSVCRLLNLWRFNAIILIISNLYYLNRAIAHLCTLLRLHSRVLWFSDWLLLSNTITSLESMYILRPCRRLLSYIVCILQIIDGHLRLIVYHFATVFLHWQVLTTHFVFWNLINDLIAGSDPVLLWFISYIVLLRAIHIGFSCL